MSILREIEAQLAQMSPEDQAALVAKAKENIPSNIIWHANPGPQSQAYSSKADILYYGGAAGGGKSQLAVGLALNEHRISRLFRTHYKDLEGEGGLIPAMGESLGRHLKTEGPTTKGYNGQKRIWIIPETDVRRSVEFGAFTNENEAQGFQGRAADLFVFDEAVQFPEHLVEFIIGWNRPGAGVPPDQRCRVLLCSNPPVTPEGLWIFDWFAPWLDPEYPDPLGKGPAEPGELRWFTRINGILTEVDEDHVHYDYDARGNQIEVRPRSRTFIPASLGDNPDLEDAGYGSQLANLPKHLQDALLRGQFSTTMDDAERQVIPTAWVLAAQKRWKFRQQELVTTPMTALGVDVASGGEDRMVCVPLHGTTFNKPETKPGSDVRGGNEKTAFVLSVAKDDPQFNVDNNGYGDDLCTDLESNNFNVKRIKGTFAPTKKAPDGREYDNYRAQMIWEFRLALDPEKGENIALPPDRHTLAELCSFREQPHEDMRNKIKIESKDKIVERIGRSPDLARAYMFAWAKPDVLAKKKRREHLADRRNRGTPKVIHQRAKVTGRR